MNKFGQLITFIFLFVINIILILLMELILFNLYWWDFHKMHEYFTWEVREFRFILGWDIFISTMNSLIRLTPSKIYKNK